MHKRNSFVKNSNNLESIVSPSRSTFLNNSKLPKNNNHVQINLNQNTSEIKETLGNDNKKTETIKNSVIPNKILKIPKTKSNKKLNVNRQSLSNEKYYQNIKTIFKAALNPKKNPKNNQAIFIKTNEMKNFKNDNLRTLNSMYSSKNIKNDLREIKDKSSVSLNTSIQNNNIPMSPKINIMLNSNFVSPKIAPKSFSSMKKSNKVVNTSINSGVSPKSWLLLDTIQIKILDKAFVLENYKLYSNEKEELIGLNEIYYLGKIPTRTFKETCLDESICQNSLDDEEGYYTIIKGDHLLYRYELISELGRGSYGQGVKCFDHKVSNFICVKVIRNKKKFYNQALIETKILNYLKEYDTLYELYNVKMIDNFVFRGHICIVFELLDMSLYEILKAQNFRGMNLTDIRKIAYQLLKSLEFLKKHSIIHCDFKPENILLKKKSNKGEVKIIDFGSACFEDEKLYSYIQSRFYRAPEVLLGSGYSTSIDIWSLGCILAELYNGIPIFPGETEVQQLYLIIEYLGIPPNNMIAKSKKKSIYFDEEYNLIKLPNSSGKFPHVSTKRIEKFLDYCNDKFIDLIKKCLVLDPEKRIKPTEALQHPFFEKRIKGIRGMTINTYKRVKTVEVMNTNETKSPEKTKTTRVLTKMKSNKDIKKSNNFNETKYHHYIETN